jgi:hypothetical protein
MKKARGIAKASLDFVDQRIEDLERVIDRFIPYAQTNTSGHPILAGDAPRAQISLTPHQSGHEDLLEVRPAVANLHFVDAHLSR